jgi:methylglutaconyl-CoA hydratase
VTLPCVEVQVAGGIAHVTLNRTAKRNALDAATIEVLTDELLRCAEDSAVRVVQLTGSGPVFCAGADLVEMRDQRHASEAENLAHARKLARLLSVLDSLPKPTLARVNGDGYGGALGLIGACDIVVVADHAKFAFTEVRLGIIPAVISPFVLAKMSQSAASRYFLTAEIIDAATLEALGLAHEVTPAEQLDAVCARITAALLKGAPSALAEAKALIRDVASGDPSSRASTSQKMAARLARLRLQPEAQEGFEAFFAKRKPVWQRE